ncbi:MAG: hypothetical protein H6719_11965 [Sandaracinaceae bacterium]|nr:hypothetical protein [Sandaracinaceae bacterium]
MTGRGLALALGGLALAAGCTTMSNPGFPDAGPLDASLDAAPPMMEDAARPPAPTRETCTEAGRGATIGQPCAGDTACDDGCFCNGVERCEGGACVAAEDPCVDDIDCTADSCLEEVNRCIFDPQPEMCSDGDACNGAEVCDLAVGCLASAPLYCNDESSCTVDSCDTLTGCVFSPRDLDGDGFFDGRCGGDDCDDDPRFGRMIYPGAPEDCTNRRDDDCDGSRDYNDSDCVPTNDTCALATVLPGPGTYSGSTRALLSDYTLGCSTSRGPDSVFRFTLDDTRDVTVSVSGAGAGAAVTIRAWADCAAGPEVRCSAASPPSVIRRSLPAGEYAIIVQTPGGIPFDLTLRAESPTPDPPGDTCDSALDITSGTEAADAAVLLQDTLPSCNSTFGSYRDAYFTFELTSVSDVTLTTSDTAFHYVNLMTTCGDLASEVRCWSGSGSPMQTWRSLPAGRYWVTVGTSTTTGPVSATVDIRPPTPIPPNDRCGGAIMLRNGSSRTDTTIDFGDDVAGGTCAGTARLDAFYVITLSSRRRVLISVSDADGGTTRFYLTLRGDCGTPSDTSSIACVSGLTSPAPASATLNQVLDPGTYYLIVETAASDTSDYTISAALFAP